MEMLRLFKLFSNGFTLPQSKRGYLRQECSSWYEENQIHYLVNEGSRKIRIVPVSEIQVNLNKTHLKRQCQGSSIETQKASYLNVYSEISFNSELGSKQSRWLVLHFCARWNAKNTLEYIIKTIYH